MWEQDLLKGSGLESGPWMSKGSFTGMNWQNFYFLLLDIGSAVQQQEYLAVKGTFSLYSEEWTMLN